MWQGYCYYQRKLHKTLKMKLKRLYWLWYNITMTIVRDVKGRFTKGNSYWLGRKGKKSNKGSFKKGVKAWNKGKRHYKICERCGKKFSTNRGYLTKPHQRFCSMSCRSWRNGNTPISHRIWNGVKAKRWRKAIHERDKVCVFCGADKNLHCDHIKPQSLYPELRYNLANGRLLCFDCHKKTETYGYKGKI